MRYAAGPSRSVSGDAGHVLVGADDDDRAAVPVDPPDLDDVLLGVGAVDLLAVDEAVGTGTRPEEGRYRGTVDLVVPLRVDGGDVEESVVVAPCGREAVERGEA